MSRNNRHEESANRAQWTNVQVAILLTMALVFGAMFGYLYRGTSTSAPPAEVAAAAPSPAPAPQGQPKSMPTLDSVAESLLASAQQNPKDPAPYAQLGNLYSDHKKYDKAVEFYTKALEIKPNDVNVRTDLGTALWYSGDAKKALAEYDKSLKVDPKHPQTLFNVGVVKWQGLGDGPGAIAAWQKLLQLNPDFPQRSAVEGMIQQARSGKPAN